MIRLFGTRDDLLAVLTAQWANEQLGLGERMPGPAHATHAGKTQKTNQNVCTID